MKSEYAFLGSLLEDILNMEKLCGAYWSGGTKNHVSALIIKIDNRRMEIEQTSAKKG